MFEYYKKLIALRKSNSVLSTGEFEFIEATGTRLAYKRFDANNEIIVLFNMGEKAEKFVLPPAKNVRNLLTGNQLMKNTLILPKYSAAVLRVSVDTNR